MRRQRPHRLHRLQGPPRRRPPPQGRPSYPLVPVLVVARLPGVGLPRKAVRGDTSYDLCTPDGERIGVALCWEDVRGLTEGVVTRRVIDDTLPGGPVERAIEYHAPFDRCDREQDYRMAWPSLGARTQVLANRDDFW